ncbi:MAG: D,D-heptose 1,7-bisphosphate phosphatase [Alphaproteobacteria bacterium]|nr:D,D-heptose 1,7-bisphosphate phosphatase [Alphaproteobacteria bacterium]
MAGPVTRKAVFLDRDGVLNRSPVIDGKPYAPCHVRDFRLLPKTRRAADRLKRAGFLLIVVTNQPDIGNGLVAAETVAEMHRRLRERLPVDDIRMCPHAQDAGCDCRKPAPGMLIAAARSWNISLPDSFLVGDRYSDIEAANRAGCRGILVDRGYREVASCPPFARVRSLSQAVDMICSGHVANLG